MVIARSYRLNKQRARKQVRIWPPHDKFHPVTTQIFETRELRLQGGLVPNKISGVGTKFGLLVHVLPGPT
jgi:hypothetical protein